MANTGSSNDSGLSLRHKVPPADGHEHLQQRKDQKRPAKLFHRKSRTGCKQCRTRRVKCNESRPICFPCHRLDLICVYDRDLAKYSTSAQPQPSDKEQGQMSSPSTDEDGLEFPESEERRKLEILLFRRYLMDTVSTISMDDMALLFYGEQLPRMALKSNALLYSVYFLSAIDLEIRGGTDACLDDKDLVRNSGGFSGVSQMYFSMALKEHTSEVTQLSGTNADMACMTATLLRIYYFTLLSTRPLDPYRPPSEWLGTMSASQAVFKLARPLLEKGPASPVSTLMARAVKLTSENRADPDNMRHFSYILQRQYPHEVSEAWDEETVQAYEFTLSDIGRLWGAMEGSQFCANLRRRIAIFPVFVPERFVKLVEETRPRALVILAHYFALVAVFRETWWIGDAGVREVLAIESILPDQWRWMMKWPLQMLDRDPIPRAALIRTTGVSAVVSAKSFS